MQDRRRDLHWLAIHYQIDPDMRGRRRDLHWLAIHYQIDPDMRVTVGIFTGWNYYKILSVSRVVERI